MLKRVLVAALAAASVACAAAAAAPTPATFTDPAGDNGAAPDLAGVTVSNDAVGTYSFDVTFSTDYAADSQFYLYLDTDKNANTGDPQNLGADYVIWDDHAQHAADLYKWNGTDFGDTPEKTLDFEIGSDSRSLSIAVNKSELGNASTFDFFVLSSDADGSAGHYDDGPSGSGAWEYTEQNALALTAGPLKSAVDRKTRLWVIAMAVVRSDTGKTVGSEGAIGCKSTGGAVALGQRFYAGAAACVFRLPKKHVKVTGTITVAYGGKTATKTASIYGLVK